MPRRDGPTTMGSYVLVPDLLRSGRSMNDDLQELGAQRELRDHLEKYPKDESTVRRLAKSMTARDILQSLQADKH